jgi:hypothetical protein
MYRLGGKKQKYNVKFINIYIVHIFRLNGIVESESVLCII